MKNILHVTILIDRNTAILKASLQAMAAEDLSIVYVDLLPTDRCFSADFTNTDIAEQLRALKGEPRLPLPFSPGFNPEYVRDWLQDRMPQHVVMLGAIASRVPGTAQGIDFFA